MSLKRKRVESVETESTDRKVVESEGSSDAFARAFASVMKRDIAPDKGAVLAKRKTAVLKQIDREKLAAKASSDVRKQRKAARVAQLVVPATDVLGYERQLKKVATKGGMRRSCDDPHTTNTLALHCRTLHLQLWRCLMRSQSTNVLLQQLQLAKLDQRKKLQSQRPLLLMPNPVSAFLTCFSPSATQSPLLLPPNLHPRRLRFLRTISSSMTLLMQVQQTCLMTTMTAQMMISEQLLTLPLQRL
jgi:hypothetical protein